MFELLPHQAVAVPKLKTGSVLVGGVGSGKSVTALEYARRVDPNGKIVVITTAKKRDSGEWIEDAMMMHLRNEVVIDSWNNIKNYTGEQAFFIFDEQRVVGGGAWVAAFLTIARNNPWILLSATPSDTWMDLVPVFIANGFYKNKTEFNDQHVRFSRFTRYPKVDGYLDIWRLEKYREAIFVEMPYLSPAKRNEIMVEVEFDDKEQKSLWTDRWNFYDDMPVKDAGELMRLLRKSANSHPSRCDALRKIMEKHDKVIVFYNHNYELEILRTFHTELDIPVAEWNGHNHQDIPRTDRWLYIVQYQAGAEGWNCTSTDTVVSYSLPYSYRNFEQSFGRIDRQNTKFEVLNRYIFKSRAIIDQGIWKSLGRKKNFQASAFAKKTWPKMQTKTTPIN